MSEQQSAPGGFMHSPTPLSIATDTDFRKYLTASRQSSTFARNKALAPGMSEVRRFKPKPLVPICYSHSNKQSFAV